MLIFLKVLFMFVEYIFGKILKNLILVSPFSCLYSTTISLVTLGAIDFLDFLVGYLLDFAIGVVERTYAADLLALLLDLINLQIMKILQYINQIIYDVDQDSGNEKNDNSENLFELHEDDQQQSFDGINLSENFSYETEMDQTTSSVHTTTRLNKSIFQPIQETNNTQQNRFKKYYLEFKEEEENSSSSNEEKEENLQDSFEQIMKKKKKASQLLSQTSIPKTKSQTTTEGVTKIADNDGEACENYSSFSCEIISFTFNPFMLLNV
eukprot:TRINITY_DN40946_c0_g1_i1.p1 TRINITY_DN40946_c0_g1~~TRINITY_DN40946_c0_g1_i1.p1  ORF type:complete len:266 (-),score=37.85 TRINITY_DN40946_c0_g1_i1:1566-2363(-)